MKKKHDAISKALSYSYRHAKKEFDAWVKVAKYYGAILPLALIGFIALILYVKPFPDGSAYLAVGQKGSSYIQLGKRFQEEFLNYGIKLNLVETAGLIEGLEGLESDKSQVNATFYTAGASNGRNYPELVSLGSVQYAPLWLFYRGKEVVTDDPFEYFDGKKVAIGLNGTVTNKIFRRLYLENQQCVVNGSNFIEAPHSEEAQRLKKGEIDAMFIVDSISAPVVADLLADPSIQVMNFTLADAYLRQFPFLRKITIPRGSLNISKVLPKIDITLLASTTTLLVDKKTHGAVQWGLILAARNLARDHRDYFAPEGYFPRYLDTGFELSPVAKQYYNTGVPAVFSYFPLWVASLIDRLGVIFLAFFAFAYPVYKTVSGWRSYPSRKYVSDMYGALKQIQDAAHIATTLAELEALQAELEMLRSKHDHAWIDDSDVGSFFGLKNGTIPSVAKDIEMLIEKIKDQSALTKENQN